MSGKVEYVACPTCDGMKDARASRCQSCARPPNFGIQIRKSDNRAFVRCRDGSITSYARVLMESRLRRELAKSEHVHHRNGNCTDDRVENLEVLSATEHQRLHGHGWQTSRWQSGICSTCGCLYDERTRGCATCGTRHRRRRAKATA